MRFMYNCGHKKHEYRKNFDEIPNALTDTFTVSKNSINFCSKCVVDSRAIDVVEELI